ncbi:MAG: sulfotransferase, partial [Hyphomicrobiales bacterium]
EHAVGFDIAAHPADAEAHRMLGAIVVRKDVDAEVEAVESLLARENILNDEQRAQLEFTLGTAYDDLGDEGRASAHFSRGNALIRKLRPFDLDAALRRMEELKQTFAAIEPPPLAPPTGPVFIVGLPRSGKTTLEGMLARHPVFYPGGELSAAATHSSAVHQRGKDGAQAAAALGRRYLAMAAALAPGRRLLDTMPNNFLLLGTLRLALPGARILHCTRDPEAHAAALQRKLFLLGGNEYTSDAADLDAYLAAYRELMSFWRQRFPDFVMDVDMSDAIAQLPSILQFLGAPWHEAVTAPCVSEPRLAG